MDQRTTDPATPPRAASDATHLLPGTRLGRYQVVDLIGSGGMGEVFRARDIDLGRPAAIKVLRGDLVGRHTDAILREAQAMAKLSHPNVVVVYEVGTVDGHVFLAMEHVAGQTVRDWLRGGRRSRRAILDVFLAAGRGLAAAHDAGIVRRDAKPDNVLIGADGRVRVADFGLAGGASGAADAAPDPGSADTVRYSARASGTPAYMSPEQHLRQPLDARSDEFSYCVSLWEALYGDRPFAGDTLRELRAHVTAGEIAEPRARTAVPGWLRAVLLRGLRVRRDDRFATMAELLGALARDPAARWRRAAVAATLIATTGLAAFGLLRPRADVCSAAGRDFAQVWSDRRAAVARQLLGSGLPYAGVAAARALQVVDRWSEAFAGARVEACAAADDARATCLADVAGETRAKIDALLAADRQAVDHVDDLLASLPDVRDCTGVTPQAADLRLPRDPDRRLQTMLVRSNLYSAQALVTGGKSKAAADLARAAVGAARQLAHRPTLALALAVQAKAVGKLGDWRAQEELDGDAMVAAASVGDERIVATAAEDLAVLLVSLEPHLDDARRYARFAIAVAEHARLDRARINAEYALGEVELVAGRLDESQRHFDAARALAERVVGTDDVLHWRTLDGLGMVTSERGDQAAALGHFLRALEIRTRVSGPRHRAVALERTNIANVLGKLGRYREARAEYLEAVAIDLAALGPRHGQTAFTLLNLAATESELGLFESSAERSRQVLPVMESSFGAGSLSVASAHRIYAVALAALDRLSEARAEVERALSIVEKVRADHPDMIDTLEARAVVAARDRRFPDALADLDRAAALAATVEGGAARAPRLHLELGWTALAAGDARRAATEAQTTRELVAMRPAAGFVSRNADVLIGAALAADGKVAAATETLQPIVVAAAAGTSQGALDRAFDDLGRFALACALWRGGGDQPRALALAAEALRGFRAEREWLWAERAERWLHDPASPRSPF